MEGTSKQVRSVINAALKRFNVGIIQTYSNAGRGVNTWDKYFLCYSTERNLRESELQDIQKELAAEGYSNKVYFTHGRLQRYLRVCTLQD